MPPRRKVHLILYRWCAPETTVSAYAYWMNTHLGCILVCGLGHRTFCHLSSAWQQRDYPGSANGNIVISRTRSSSLSPVYDESLQCNQTISECASTTMLRLWQDGIPAECWPRSEGSKRIRFSPFSSPMPPHRQLRLRRPPHYQARRPTVPHSRRSPTSPLPQLRPRGSSQPGPFLYRE
jgi:hypothetical protein